MQVSLYLFIFAISVVLDANGQSSSNLREKLKKLRNFNQKLNASNRYNKTPRFTHPLLRGSLRVQPQTQGKLTFKLDDVLAACKHTRGQDRKTCVTSLVRRTYPEHFMGHKKDKQHRDKSKPMSDVPSTTANTPNPACQYIESTTTTTATTSIFRKKKVKRNNSLSAVLIKPGDKKKISPITQQERGVDANNVQIHTQEPLICRAEDLGFVPEVEARFMMLSLDMLCALCKSQGDEECIIRNCVNDGLLYEAA